jgi:hypothetical protein
MTNSALSKATLRLLKPLVRIMVRYGVSFGEFRDLVKQVYVEVAEKDFRIARRKQTISRIAMLTGIQRKEVSRLLDGAADATDPLDATYNRGVRVINGWHRDAEFLNKEDEPDALPFDGETGSFSALVKRYSGDLTARAVLDELERVGSLQRDEHDLVHLVSTSGYVPSSDKEAQFNILGLSVSDLLTTLDHNLEHEETRLQLTTAYDNLPLRAVEEFRHLSSQQSRVLLQQLDEWLAEHDRDTNPDPADEQGRYRAGIGIYYIEEQIEDEK